MSAMLGDGFPVRNTRRQVRLAQAPLKKLNALQYCRSRSVTVTPATRSNNSNHSPFDIVREPRMFTR